jgi:hypothetical protein
MSTEKTNPWLDESARFDAPEKKKDIRDMTFKDNTSHKIRILPPKDPKDLPFQPYKLHWIPQNGKTVGKPITHGIDEKCPVCAWIAEQWNEIHRLKDEEGMTDKSPEVAALLEKVKKVSAKTKYDMNIIHREDKYIVNEETGEKTLAAKRLCAVYSVYTEIFSYAKKWGSPSNEKTGYDLEILTSGLKDRREYKTIPDRDASPLTKEELALLDNLYDLKALRRSTSNEDILTILEAAKAPYNEIVDYVKIEKTPKAKKTEEANVEADSEVTTEEVQKEIDEVVKETPVKEEVKREEPKAAVVEEQAETVVSEGDIENYECKGQHDNGDSACSDCPVKNSCLAAQPYYAKAKQLNIDTDPRSRKTTDVIEDVKKAENPAGVQRKGRKLPF